MMKTFISIRSRKVKNLACIILSLSLAAQVYGQEEMQIEKSQISFTSNAPLEIIKASSTELKGAIIPSTNQFAFKVLVKSFVGFNNRLQMEHFNEKYLESESYPWATFSGKIIEPVDFSTDGVYDVRAKGELEIHGQKQTRIIRCKINVRNGIAKVDTDFIVPLSDHNISIPRIVSEKIANQIEVSIHASMIAKQ
jgi:hypothetical protein